VAIELAYINTRHPDFHKEADLFSSLTKSVEDEERSKSKRNAVVPYGDMEGFRAPLANPPPHRSTSESSYQAGWLSNIMPMRPESKDTSIENTPTASPTRSEANGPVNGQPQATKKSSSAHPLGASASSSVTSVSSSGPPSPQRAVNLLGAAEVPRYTGSRMSDREKKDCEIIGEFLFFRVELFQGDFMKVEYLPSKMGDVY